MTEDWPDPLAAEYELRVTRQAREDLGVEKLAAGDLAGMQQASPWGHLLVKFADLRSRSPEGTEAPLSKVHRNDIFKLDGRGGERAVTWHDTQHGVVWLLAFTPEHDYRLMVRRAATPNSRGLGGENQLLPSADDYEELSDDRDQDWAVERTIDALQTLVDEAVKTPRATQRGTLAATVRVEVLAGDAGSRRLHVRYRVPPLQVGVLPPSIEWLLTAAVRGVDVATIVHEPFPAGAEPGTLAVACNLQ